MQDYQVSIPYRYATNYSFLWHRIGRREGFQFLIGTLQTFESIFYLLPCMVVSIPYRYATNGEHERNLCCRCWVSIPYRYATNLTDNIFPNSCLVFQFLIGTLQTQRFNSYCGIFALFQFLIGTLQTRKSGRCC